MTEETIRILLIDDDEDEFVHMRYLMERAELRGYSLEWAATFQAGLTAILQRRHDVYLVDYRLDIGTGLDLIQQALGQGCRAPMIVLTGRADRDLDLEAMKKGAADFLDKHQLSATLLDRTIRYAVRDAARTMPFASEAEPVAVRGSAVPFEDYGAVPRRPEDVLKSCHRGMGVCLKAVMARVRAGDTDAVRYLSILMAMHEVLGGAGDLLRPQWAAFINQIVSRVLPKTAQVRLRSASLASVNPDQMLPVSLVLGCVTADMAPDSASGTVEGVLRSPFPGTWLADIQFPASWSQGRGGGSPPALSAGTRAVAEACGISIELQPAGVLEGYHVRMSSAESVPCAQGDAP